MMVDCENGRYQTSAKRPLSYRACEFCQEPARLSSHVPEAPQLLAFLTDRLIFNKRSLSLPYSSPMMSSPRQKFSELRKVSEHYCLGFVFGTLVEEVVAVVGVLYGSKTPPRYLDFVGKEQNI